MAFLEAIYWIRQEAAINGVSCRDHIKKILVNYAVKQKSNAKVVPIKKC
jgi:hypothetical protein